MDHSEIEQAIEGCEFFMGLNKRDIKKIGALGQMVAHEAGEYMFRQGDFEENIYIIGEGHVLLERAMDLGSRKGNAVIAVLGKGRVCGCWSTLLGEPLNLMSSACCRKPTRVVVIRGVDLRAMMAENPGLGFNILERLCFLLRDRVQAAYGAMDKI